MNHKCINCSARKMGNCLTFKRNSDMEEGYSTTFRNTSKSNKKQQKYANFLSRNKGRRSNDGISSKRDQNYNKTTTSRRSTNQKGNTPKIQNPPVENRPVEENKVPYSISSEHGIDSASQGKAKLETQEPKASGRKQQAPSTIVRNNEIQNETSKVQKKEPKVNPPSIRNNSTTSSGVSQNLNNNVPEVTQSLEDMKNAEYTKSSLLGEFPSKPDIRKSPSEEQETSKSRTKLNRSTAKVEKNLAKKSHGDQTTRQDAQKQQHFGSSSVLTQKEQFTESEINTTPRIQQKSEVPNDQTKMKYDKNVVTSLEDKMPNARPAVVNNQSIIPQGKNEETKEETRTTSIRKRSQQSEEQSKINYDKNHLNTDDITSENRIPVSQVFDNNQSTNPQRKNEDTKKETKTTFIQKRGQQSEEQKHSMIINVQSEVKYDKNHLNADDILSEDSPVSQVFDSNQSAIPQGAEEEIEDETYIQKQEQEHLVNSSRNKNDSLKRTAPSTIEESITINKKTPKIAEAQVILPTKSEDKSIATEEKPTKDLKIINMQEHFDNDLDFDSIQYSPDSMEYLQIIKGEAEKYDEAVKSFSNTDYSIEYFLLDEKLLRLIERLDKIYCHTDPERLKLKLETIEFINKLHETLDENVIE